MNNKVLEIAKHAGFGVENGSILAETISIDIEITVELKKFAELIVKECLRNMNNCDGELEEAIWITKDVFGVEE
jgi:hypothetical protein